MQESPWNAGSVTTKRASSGTPPFLMTADVGNGTFRLRPASRRDLLAIVHLLADDSMGAARESDLDMEPYERAFEAIDADPRHLLVVGELVRQGSADTPVVSTFQISFLPGISRQGAWRSQIEGVRVAASVRGQGLGNLMIQWAIDESRRRGCSLMQLTTHKSRTAAHRFYGRLGFTADHVGMKLPL
ncbi:GNAT family N-acetyltransferase [Pseudarthrobacter phenanthrenivorans]|uniref:GNAT family N-acetyltransferase n=2 Tax=Pseudarthrobacter phenanthrenivorans TaxID=361575 RepID=A0A3B0FD46_PSEPS|nr:GNAT family N-acetyltransferase [Pseudarthrobacter phenanthrenivorans]